MAKKSADRPGPLTAMQRAAKIGAVVTLKDIRLHTIEAGLDNFTEPPPYTVDVQPSVRFQRREAHLIYQVDYHVGVVAGDQAVFDCMASFFMLYTVPQGFKYTNTDAKAFGEISVIFAAHPYARELVQGLSLRMGLPPLIMDVARAPMESLALRAR